MICFCTSNGSVRILKKARGNIFLKWYYFEEIVKIVSFWKKISSLFQYSERTVASTETNNTSAERLISVIWSHKDKGVAWSGGCHTHLPQKDIEKKSKFNGAKSGRKFFFFNLIFNILMLWAKCMPIDFQFQQGLFCILTNCQT